MRLDLTDEDLLGPATVHDEVDKVGAARLHEHLLKLQAVELQRRGRHVVTVDDGRELALAEKTARALAEEFAGGGFQLHSVGPFLIALARHG
jgi:hypothetical protein